MAKVNQRLWKVPGQRAKRKAWGYTVQVEENGRTKQKRVYKAEWTKDDAEQSLAAILLKIEQEPKPKAGGLTLAQAAERYLAAKARKRSLAKDGKILKHLKSAFGADTLLADITASRISEYKAQRLASTSARRKDANGQATLLSAASINRPLALLRHLLRLAHEEWQVIDTVPRVRLEKEPEGRIRWLEPDEETRLLSACGKSRNKQLAGIVTVALESGLRKGELLGLTWDRVDLSRGVIRLEVTKSGRRREGSHAAGGL
jgi:integrase